ncbi:MAG TPA: EscN/YscN/HrcN family type III secretion system ATPase, partial [Actinomycetales bacterium]|nr:EscN/YscN/HrcN family type III secretion system ATPase [Actinomycetales bacterium]
MTALLESPLAQRLEAMSEACRPQRLGAVRAVVGLSVDVVGIQAAVGDLLILGDGLGTEVPAEVVAVHSDGLRCMPLAHAAGLHVGMPVRTTGGPLTIPVGGQLLGRVLDGLGRPADGKGPVDGATHVSINA